MPILTEEEKKEALEKEKESINNSGIKEKFYGKKKIFIGAGGVEYTTAGEAIQSLQSEKEKESFKKLGLNEYGQTPEQENNSKKRIELLKKREVKLRELSEIDSEINSLGKSESMHPEKQKKKK